MSGISQNLRDKIFRANIRGLADGTQPNERLSRKSEEKILEECLENGFTLEFCAFVRHCHSVSGRSLDKAKVIGNLKKCENPTKNPDHIGMMLRVVQNWLIKTRGYELRFNQLVAVCGLLYEVRIIKFLHLY